MLLNASTQPTATVTIFLKKLINKKFTFFYLIFLAIASCSGSQNKTAGTPAWYSSPKQNSAENLYGVSVGATLEEATKSALADAASRLMVSISSDSTLLREEDKSGVNEEMRNQVKQNIEKIDFTNFKVSQSEKSGVQIFVEVEIKRSPFISDQKEIIAFAERQVSDLEKNLSGANPIQKRVNLLKILDLEKQIELSSRILNGAGESINLKEKLNRLAFFQNQFNQLTDKIEFYFEMNSAKEISQIIRGALNKEKIKIANSRSNSANQITIKINSSSRSDEIYGAHINKLRINFENISNSKTVASNSIEVTGSSTISEKEAYLAAVKSLEDKISQDGILKILGILN